MWADGSPLAIACEDPVFALRAFEQTDLGTQSLSSTSLKERRTTCCAILDALHRYRGKGGQQKVTVEAACG
jgi:hypothetical protein